MQLFAFEFPKLWSGRTVVFSGCRPTDEDLDLIDRRDGSSADMCGEIAVRTIALDD